MQDFKQVVSIPHGGLRTSKNLKEVLAMKRLHPTRWAQNRPRPAGSSGSRPSVTIPRGGLGMGIKLGWVKAFEIASPSHTVGLERSYTQFVNAYFVLSSSHAVGLEPDLLVHEELIEKVVSPSHMVGLEQRRGKSPTRPLRSHHPTQWAWNKKSYTLS